MNMSDDFRCASSAEVGERTYFGSAPHHNWVERMSAPRGLMILRGKNEAFFDLLLEKLHFYRLPFHFGRVGDSSLRDPKHRVSKGDVE